MKHEQNRTHPLAAAERTPTRVLVPQMLPAQAQLPLLKGQEQLAKRVENLIVAAVHLLAIGLAEVATVWVDLRLGLALYGLILLILFLQAAFDREEKVGRLCLALTLVPLIRIVSLGMPLGRFTPLARYFVVAGPLFVASAAVIFYLALRPEHVGLQFELGPFGLALLGFPLGLVEYQLLKPEPLLDTLTVPLLAIAPPVLILCAGFLEELIFRGILLHVSKDLIGARMAVLYIALLSTLLQLGWRSWQHGLLSFAAGLLFGWVVLKTREIYSVSLAHGFTAVVFWVIAPQWLAG